MSTGAAAHRSLHPAFCSSVHFVVGFEMRAPCVVQAGHKLRVILVPQPPLGLQACTTTTGINQTSKELGLGL